MRNSKRTLALTATLVAAIVGASTLYARDGEKPSGSMMRGGMMGEGNMMGQMSQMMDHCSTMMQAGPRGRRPNDQWRKDAPAKPNIPAH